MKLVTARQIQEIDSIAIQKFKIPSLTLMENAGCKVADIIREKNRPGDSVLIVVGKGNNGGDGLVAARYLLEAGTPVELALVAPPGDLSPDSAANWEKIKGLNPRVVLVDKEASLKELDGAISRSKYIVDAIFGTGLNTEVKGRYLKIIQKLNASSRPVISVDIPSGLSSDTGNPLGCAVRARVTVTFGLPKVGQVLPPGPEYVRELHVADIGFPSELIESYKSDLHITTPDLFQKYFAPRDLDAHKGDFGHVLTLAGSVGKMGAGWLTSKAALRSGAGLVTYALPAAAFSRFDTRFAEVMIEPVSDKKKGRFIPESLEDIKKICLGKDAVALGPGIGTRPDTEKAVAAIVARLNLPLVMDADGLNNLAGGGLKVLDKRRSETVLTPHPGEMARLTGKDTKSILKDRVSIARTFAMDHRVYLILKGWRTVVASPQGEVFINTTGNPGMATAGIGDALTGMIAAFIAGKIPLPEALIAAVYIHGLAGDLAASKMGEIGMITSDLIENIPQAIKLIRQWVPVERVV